MSIVTELKYTANLDKGVCMTPITPSFMGGDQEAHRITVDCYRQNSREAVDLSGAGVTAYFVRADGMTIPLTGETNGNKASVLLPAACYAVMGRFSLVIKLSLNDGTADSINTVFWGEGAVSRSRTDVVIDPDSVIPSLEELLAQIEAMEQATAAAREAAESVEGFKAEVQQEIGQLSESISAQQAVFAASNTANVSEYTNQTAIFIEHSTAHATSLYYRQVTALSTAKKYNFVVTVPVSGEYLIQAGTSSNSGSMVDTVYDGYLSQGKNLIAGYAPSGAYRWLRIDQSIEWDVDVYEQVEGSLAANVQNLLENEAKAPTVKTITAQQFAQSPYNSTIGNLDVNSIVHITPSYGAVDYPHGVAGYYTIMTTGDPSSPAQIAIRLDGRMFSRKKGVSGWYAWSTEALEYSNILLMGSNPAYTDFNDFPVGSIVSVGALALANSPEGYSNTGHDNMDAGVINATVMTFATTHDSPVLVSQICVYYRPVNHGCPRIAWRSALKVDGAYTWSKWSTLSEDGVIHATNKIVDINHLDYTFDDFNDAPINTIYQVDFNVADAVANNPAPGRSGSLMTYGFSDSSRHALTQIYIARDSSLSPALPMMFVRYGTQATTDSYVWTPWCKVVTEVVS